MSRFKLQLANKQYKIIIGVLSAALLAAVIFGYNTYTERMRYHTFLQNSYQRAFREMVTNVENINVLLEKAEVSNSPVLCNSLLTQVYRNSDKAVSNLGQIPVSQPTIAKTEKFLNQVGDFAYTISRKNAANQLMDEEENKHLSKLRDYSKMLMEELHVMEQEVAEGFVSFGDLRQRGRQMFRRASANLVDVKFGELDKRFVDYPVLIYDGPFSEHIIEGKPKGLEGEDVSLEKAKETARKFVGKKDIEKIIEYSSGNGRIKTYGLELVQAGKDRDASIAVDVTQKGGRVLWMLNQRDIGEKKLTIQQATDRAEKFLEGQGFGDLEETYFLQNNGTATITFIGVNKDGILIYPDMIKAKVALDNGDIVGFDAYQFLMSNKERNIPPPTLTEAQAKERVSKKLKISRAKLAIIPLPGNKEQLCYEFKGTYEDNDYFVYINAMSGKEENVLRILRVENGTLTQ